MNGPSSSLPCSCGFSYTPEIPPPIPPLFGTNPLLMHNDPPDDSQIPGIVEFLARAKDRVHSLDHKISALIHERETIAEDIRSHTAVISTFRRLPTEILCRIFLMTLGPQAHMELPCIPWSLALVSQRWRDVAIVLTSLWSSFGVHTSRYQDRDGKARDPDDSPEALERIREQLRRAGRASLHVTIAGKFKILPKTLHALRDSCERWETLSVEKTSHYLDKIQGRLHMLRRMHVAWGRWDWSGGPITFDFSAPSSAYRYAAEPHHIHDPLNSQLVAWETLTRYDGPVNEQSLRNLTEQATRLVECRLIFDTRKDGNVLDLPRTRNVSSLHHLRSLCVTTTTCLEHIQSPGLQEFVVDGNAGYLKGEETDIIDFLMRSACTLLRLSLFKFEATLALLQVIPALTELTIECGRREVLMSLIQNMHPVAGGPQILPNLTAISLGDLSSLLAPAVEMVSARFHKANGCSQLRFFGTIMDVYKEQSNRIFLHTDTVNHLAALQSAGLQLCFVKTRPKYSTVRATDPYSIRRCAEYDGLSTSRIWEE